MTIPLLLPISHIPSPPSTSFSYFSAMRISLALVFALLYTVFPYTFPSLQAQGYPLPEPGMDVQHYRFEMEINDENDSIRGVATLFAEWKQAEAEKISLDLIGPREEYPGYGMTATLVKVNGDTAEFSQNGLELLVDLPARNIGDVGEIEVHYFGKPADGLVISRNIYGDRTFFGDNWPTRGRFWLPVVDHPSEKATCEWWITAPNHYQVVANGAWTETRDLGEGKRLHHYHCETPLAPKVMVFGAAEFAVSNVGFLRNIPVSAWVYPRSRDGGFYDYQLALPILTFFDSLVAPYPFAKLANVQSTTRFGGMENASNVFYDERSVTGDRSSEGLIAHELAHQWFGNSASEADWPHLWLSEGFATYFASIWLAHAHGEDRLYKELEIDRRTIFRAGPAVPLVPSKVEDPMSLLNANSYEKGGWVLHMLRLELGDDIFFEGIRSYYDLYKGKVATTGQFQAVMEETSGEDLEIFFTQWVHSVGHPKISGTWSCEDSTMNIELRQLHPAGQRWDVPVEIGVMVEGDSEMYYFSLRSDKRKVSETFQLPANVVEVVWDPRMKLLAEGSIVEE